MENVTYEAYILFCGALAPHHSHQREKVQTVKRIFLCIPNFGWSFYCFSQEFRLVDFSNYGILFKTLLNYRFRMSQLVFNCSWLEKLVLQNSGNFLSRGDEFEKGNFRTRKVPKTNYHFHTSISRILTCKFLVLKNLNSKEW